jgi:hypothetical protein
MYPNEIAEFIKSHNYQLKGKDIEQVIDIKKNPQLTRIKFDNSKSMYEMWDSYGNYFKFKAKTIDDMER